MLVSNSVEKHTQKWASVSKNKNLCLFLIFKIVCEFFKCSKALLELSLAHWKVYKQTVKHLRNLRVSPQQSNTPIKSMEQIVLTLAILKQLYR